MKMLRGSKKIHVSPPKLLSKRYRDKVLIKKEPRVLRQDIHSIPGLKKRYSAFICGSWPHRWTQMTSFRAKVSLFTPPHNFSLISLTHSATKTSSLSMRDLARWQFCSKTHWPESMALFSSSSASCPWPRPRDFVTTSTGSSCILAKSCKS